MQMCKFVYITCFYGTPSFCFGVVALGGLLTGRSVTGAVFPGLDGADTKGVVCCVCVEVTTLSAVGDTGSCCAVVGTIGRV